MPAGLSVSRDQKTQRILGKTNKSRGTNPKTKTTGSAGSKPNLGPYSRTVVAVSRRFGVVQRGRVRLILARGRGLLV